MIRSALICDNKQITPCYFRMSLLAPQIAATAKPGQFINIRISDGYEPLLRRPFSIHRVSSRFVEILYKAIGKGTELLSRKKPGEALDIIGPLGNGFTYDLRPTTYDLLIGGGIGIAPLLFLAEKMKGHQITGSPCHQIIVLIGAKTKDEILCEKGFKSFGCKVKIATDDGSRGFKGKVTELLKSILRKTHSAKRIAIYTCGPKPMLKIVAETIRHYKISCQASLDEFFACGIGACLGCAVKAQGARRKAQGENRKTFHLPPSTLNNFEYKLVCKDGPVFNIEDIVWE